MTAKTKATSRILDAVHETARDLHAAGFIDKRRMRHYDALYLAPVPKYSSEMIRALRDRCKLSQAALASILNTSLSTVRQWEIGEKHPSSPSLKLLDLLDRKGLESPDLTRQTTEWLRTGTRIGVRLHTPYKLRRVSDARLPTLTRHLRAVPRLLNCCPS